MARVNPPQRSIRHGAQVLSATLLLSAVALAPLRACWGPELESVHFHSFRPDFLRMPQPWRGHPGESRALPYSQEWYTRDSDPDESKPKRVGAVARLAMQRESAGEFHAAAELWERYARLRRENPLSDWERNQEFAQFRGLDERIAALRAWQSEADTPSLRYLLEARDAISKSTPGDAPGLLRRVVSPRLRWHAGYLRAVLVYRTDPGEKSAAAFRALLQHGPRSPLATYMVARSYFHPVYQEAVDEEAANEKAAQKAAPGATTPPKPKLDANVRTHYLRSALNAYAEVVALDPRGTYGRDAAGMAAACRFRLGDRAGALHYYCLRLASLSPGQNDDPAWISARNCLAVMQPAEHHAFQASAAAQPAVAAAYLDLLLHYGKPTEAAAARLGSFALDVLRRNRDPKLSGKMLVRLAVIEDRIAHPDRAVRLAEAAIKRLPASADRDQSRWQRALALHHLDRDDEAIAEYERVAASAQAEQMRRGAWEALAVLYEHHGNRIEALRHYLVLGYRPDYGYLIDCLMSENELHAYLSRHPGDPHAKLIRYSIGYRQLRRGDYTAAVRTFEALGDWLAVAEKKYKRETSHGYAGMPPLQVARMLADLQRKEQLAKTPGERARAAYAAAQLVFHQRHLVFYNGALWTGGRTWVFEMNEPYNIETRESQLSPEERRKLDRYQQEHTALFQAARMFERIAHDYPRTPTAPRALYSAELSYTLLPSVERYWNDDTYTTKAIALYRKLIRDYPDDPLAPAAARYGGIVRKASR